MGARHSSSFEILGIAHVKAFMLYGRTKRKNDFPGLQAVFEFLVENVDTCKSEIKARIPIPGLGLLIGSRFQDSMRAELLLFDDPSAAIAELHSCHESIVKALTLAFSRHELWKKLWNDQLIAMLDFINEDNATTETSCIIAAQALGRAFDSMSGSKISPSIVL
jgi:hypothetical protein